MVSTMHKNTGWESRESGIILNAIATVIFINLE
jgi:hypothetical protein